MYLHLVYFSDSVNKPLAHRSRVKCTTLSINNLSEGNKLTHAKNTSAFEKADPYILNLCGAACLSNYLIFWDITHFFQTYVWFT